ncbi:putative serine carboxypeptidase-like 19-like [Capsicum annuum]|uniref:serine carboxypeptidase-like 2 n=1 Tax=Capsicum annuum TaxID=4072 RepID=UPI001FB13498|nr:serine carboxypeptidase-like 2 [Capsicum annuum]KAF3665916.1 putative serine carboxypeptidase-like 19-like [Capsicum annuum]KAF3668569.1 putative serine carboxypeptidase-like 19-like [Capsicum annuum]
MAKRKRGLLVLCCNLFSVLLFLLAEVLHFSERVVAAGSPVKFLPGFKGPLPFELETGLLFEIGPITFEPVEYGDFKPAEYNSSFPSLVLNPHTWKKVASFIFLDLPVCTGFSYARTSAARQSDDMQASDHAYQFLHKWFNGHPEFLRNSFYMAGDSYSGLGVPIVSQLIANGNAKGLEPFINLKGYLLGNPLTYRGDYNQGILYAHGMGLISDELFEVRIV